MLMLQQETAPIIKRTGQMPAMFAHWYSTPTTRFAIFQWMVVGAVGILLGCYLVVATSSSLKKMVFLVMIAVSPFLMVIAVRIIGNAQKLFLAMILLDVSLNVDKNFSFQEAASSLSAVPGFSISLTSLCLVFLYAWWFAEIVTRRASPLPPAFFRMSRPLIIYLIITTLSIFRARYVGLSLFEINLLINAFLLYIYVIYAIRTRQDVYFVITLLLLGLVLQSLLVIVTRVTGFSIDLLVIRAAVDPVSGRVAGTIGNTNGTGAYLTLMLVIALSFLATPLGRWYKRLAAVAFGLGLVALVLSGSRGAWLGFAIGITLFWLLAWRRGLLSLKMPIVMFIFAIPILVSFQDLIIGRISGEDTSTLETRLSLMKVALNMIRDHWLVGVGANNYAFNMLDYYTPEFSMTWIKTVHNKYLLVWAETGILGLIAFIWFLVTTINRGWQVWRLKDRFLSPLALSFSLAIIAWMVHMNFDLFHNRPQVQSMLLVAGMITAIYNLGRIEP